MKKYILFILLVTTIGSTIYAQSKKQIHVPDKVKSAFVSYYPEAVNVKWNKDPKGFEVNFILENISASLVLNVDGKLLETETSIPQTELPNDALEHVSKNFRNYKITETAKIVKCDGTITYEVQITKSKIKKDLFFTVDGKNIQKK
jgi:hypothetical protein